MLWWRHYPRQLAARVTAGPAAISSWRVTVTFNGTFTQLWGGRTTVPGSSPYTVTNETWNGNLSAGAFTTFGFLASTSGSSGATVTVSCTSP